MNLFIGHRAGHVPKEILQRCCGGFLAAMSAFESKFPEAFVTAERGAIERACLAPKI